MTGTTVVYWKMLLMFRTITMGHSSEINTRDPADYWFDMLVRGVMAYRLTRMRIGSVMNLLVISRMSWGSVADRRTT